jgi:Zn-dependent protease with chaperone function
MNLLAEFKCFGLCLKVSELAPFVALLFVISISLLSASFMIKKPKQRLMTFVSSQVAGLLAIIITFYLMKCSEMLSIYFYLGYVAVSSVLIFGVLRFYDKIMIRRLSAKPVENIIAWVQGFVDQLTNATVYYYDSAAPRAFAAGRSIFVSIGLLEMLNNDELKAVLAHEAWHIRHNSRTPYLKKLAIMTFSSHKSPELESMADTFAAEIAGIEALAGARNKVDKVFI